MNVSLTHELEEIVREKIASGLYGSAAEVIREALHLIVERDQFLDMQREALRRDIRAGLAQLDRGESVTPTPKEIMDRVDERLRREQ